MSRGARFLFFNPLPRFYLSSLSLPPSLPSFLSQVTLHVSFSGVSVTVTASGLSVPLAAGVWWVQLTPLVDWCSEGLPFHHQGVTVVGQVDRMIDPGGLVIPGSPTGWVTTKSALGEAVNVSMTVVGRYAECASAGGTALPPATAGLSLEELAVRAGVRAVP